MWKALIKIVSLALWSSPNPFPFHVFVRCQPAFAFKYCEAEALATLSNVILDKLGQYGVRSLAMRLVRRIVMRLIDGARSKTRNY